MYTACVFVDSSTRQQEGERSNIGDRDIRIDAIASLSKTASFSPITRERLDSQRDLLRCMYV